MLTLALTTLLLLAAYLIAPATARIALLVAAGFMLMLVSFTSVELTLYLLILSTLLSPELQFGGGESALVQGQVSTTESRGVTVRLDDLILTVTCLTWLFRMAIVTGLGVVRKTPINQPVAVYLLITTLATVAGFGADRVHMYGFFFVLKYLEYFVLFYMIINQVNDEAAVKRYITVMLFTCLVASLVGIAQIPTGERVSAPFEGQVGEPNTFGGYLVLMFSVTLGMFLHEPDVRLRRRLILLTGIILVPLAFTESRSSYLALVASMGFFLIFSEKKRFVVVSCIVGLMLAPFLLPGNVIQRVTYTFEQTREAGQIALGGGVHLDTSTSARLRSWQLALERDFFSHPVIGVGVTGGEFMDAQYPRVLSETGVLGLLAFLWLLRRIWVILRRCYREIGDRRIKGAALGTLCGFGGLLFHALGSNSFIIVRIMEPLMILIALMFAALLAEHPERFLQKTAEAGQ